MEGYYMKADRKDKLSYEDRLAIARRTEKIHEDVGTSYREIALSIGIGPSTLATCRAMLRESKKKAA